MIFLFFFEFGFVFGVDMNFDFSFSLSLHCKNTARDATRENVAKNEYNSTLR